MSEPAGSAIERWDERYAGREYVWDVGPNQFVERQLAALSPGTAIDLAAGEGRNSVWLAQGGWHVRAVDFSKVGLDKAGRLAADHGVADRVELVEADVLSWAPPQPVDLVVIAYLQIREPARRIALVRAASWLKPGGTLLVVAHDRSNVEHGHGGPPDADVCYDLNETLDALTGLEIETAEIARREVDTEDGLRTALDTLVVARRPR